MTPFQCRVYQALEQVPSGRVISYSMLAQTVGCASARAVGQALRANPLAPRVPCHRVIGADGRIGGFQGQREGEAVVRKRALLAREGVSFDRQGRLRNPALMLSNRRLGLLPFL